MQFTGFLEPAPVCPETPATNRHGKESVLTSCENSVLEGSRCRNLDVPCLSFLVCDINAENLAYFYE